MTDFLSRITGKEFTLRQSILNHIQLLLNVRQGSLMHMPDYGLPEYHIDQGFSENNKSFASALKEVIERYEPRVRSLVVEEINRDQGDCVLQLTLKASLANVNDMRFDALLLTGGGVLVRNRL